MRLEFTESADFLVDNHLGEDGRLSHAHTSAIQSWASDHDDIDIIIFAASQMAFAVLLKPNTEGFVGQLQPVFAHITSSVSVHPYSARNHKSLRAGEKIIYSAS